MKATDSFIDLISSLSQDSTVGSSTADLYRRYWTELDSNTQKTQPCKGYECTDTLMAVLLIRLKGLNIHRARVALNREMVLPLFSTINV